MSDSENDRAAPLSAAVDLQAIVRVLHEYAEGLDYGLREQFLGCFTEDAVFEIRFPEEVPETYPERGGSKTSQATIQYTGANEIEAFFLKHTHAPNARHKHIVTNSIVDVTGDVAQARSYFQRLDVDEDGVNFTRTFGRYLDELRRIGSVWKIARRVGEPDWIDLRAIRTTAAV